MKKPAAPPAKNASQLPPPTVPSPQGRSKRATAAAQEVGVATVAVIDNEKHKKKAKTAPTDLEARKNDKRTRESGADKKGARPPEVNEYNRLLHNVQKK